MHPRPPSLREYFFKYTDPSTAEAILSNQTFRYSSPLNFNDPFDIQTDLCSDFEKEDFSEEIMNAMERLIQSDTPLPNQNGHSFVEVISLLREKSKIHGYRKDAIREIILPILGNLHDEFNRSISLLNSNWQESMEESRVFCVTEKKDNLLMWAHYTGDHRGIVFQIATLPERDTPLSAAKKVTYVETPISVSREELIIWTLLGIEPDRSKFTYSSYAHQKSDIWSYEEEWRVVDMCDYSDKTESHVDHPFIPEQIQKIFFGCKSGFEFRNNIMRLTKKINPNTAFFLAKKRKAEYALVFEKI